MDFIISQEIAQKVLDYLATQPYKEVHILVSRLMALSPLKEETPKDVKEAPAK